MPENSGLHQLTGKIDTIEVATRAIKGCSTAIYILAGMDILASIIQKGPFVYYMEGFLWAFWGRLLYKFKSRVVAVVIMILSLINLASFFISHGSFLALILFWIAYWSVQSAFKYHSFTTNVTAI